MEGVNRKLVRQTQLLRYPCIIVMSCFESISIYYVASMNFVSLFFKASYYIILLQTVQTVGPQIGSVFQCAAGRTCLERRCVYRFSVGASGSLARLWARQPGSTVPFWGFRHRMFSLRNRQSFWVLSLTTLGYLRIHKAKAIRMLCSYFARRAWGKSVFDSVRFTLSELGQVAIVCAPASLTASVNFGGSLLSDSAENGGPSRGFPAWKILLHAFY